MVDVLGVKFANMTFDEAVERSLELCKNGGYCVTANPEIVQLCRKDAEFANAVNGANMVVADGIGVLYAAKLLGTPLKAKIPGIELAEAIMSGLAGGKDAAEDSGGGKVYLFGAKPGVAEQAAERLTERFPGLRVVGTHDGYGYGADEVIDEVEAAKPDLVLVCLGAKRQEMFAVSYCQKAKHKCLLIGLGGSLDVFSGNVERAPEAWRRRNLEWLYRIVKQPTRIKRAAQLPLFLLSVVNSKIKRGIK
jgi:N-acetylglucosaminyldiphosphoundecaprenol N-acetyl-beta-D-mannosaminyltransferase